MKKKVIFILCMAIFASAVSGVISIYLIAPKYESSTQVMVNSTPTPTEQADMNQIQTDLQLINSYQVLIQSPLIVQKVISDLGLNTTYEGLRDQLIVGSQPNSRIMDISVVNNDAESAALIANTIVTVFKEEVTGIMNLDNVTILSEATAEYNQVSPQPLINIVIAFIVGLFAAIGLVFFLEYLDNTYKREQDIEELLQIPVLSSVSVIDSDKRIFKKIISRKYTESEQIHLGGGQTIESYES